MLGRDLQRGARRPRGHRARPRRARRHRPRRRRGRRRRPRRDHQRRRVHARSTTPRRTRRRRTRSTRSAPRNLAARGRRRPVPGSCRSRPTTCSTARGTPPYPEDAPLDPLSAYGRTKAAGERLVLEAQPRRAATSCAPPGSTAQHGPNFARTMLRLAAIARHRQRRRRPARPADLDGRPRRADRRPGRRGRAGRHLPRHELRARRAGIDFARAVFEVAGLDPDRVTRTDSAAFVRPAPRPALLRARPRRLARGRARADARLAATPSPTAARRGSVAPPMTTLRVIIDQIVAPVPGGIGRYTEELTRQLIATAPADCRCTGIVSASPEPEYERIARAAARPVRALQERPSPAASWPRPGSSASRVARARHDPRDEPARPAAPARPSPRPATRSP